MPSSYLYVYNRLFTCISIAPQECSVPVLYSFEKLVIGQARPMPNICFELCLANLLNIRLTCTEMKHKTLYNFISSLREHNDNNALLQYEQ